ncbi:hypothetical protein V1511DRAFT_459138 [Dipodascopsis uninucleata]
MVSLKDSKAISLIKSLFKWVTHSNYQVATVYTAFIGLGGILCGYDTGSISGIMNMTQFIKQFANSVDSSGQPILTSSQKSLILSILSAGSATGSLSVAHLADTIGRRPSIMLGCVILSVGVIVQLATDTMKALAIGRFIAGVGVGLLSSLIPLYQSETSSQKNRGTVVSSYQLHSSIGGFFSSVINELCKDNDTALAYKLPIALQLLWAVLLFFLVIFIPETARYYTRKGQLAKARQSISLLMSVPENSIIVTNELELMSTDSMYAYTKKDRSCGWKSIFTTEGRQLFRLFTGIGVQVFQQLAGSNFVFYFGPEYFKSIGVNDTYIISMINTAINSASTVPALLLIEKLGRRLLLNFGAIAMAITQFILAGVGFAKTSETKTKVQIALSCIYLFCYSCTWGSTASVISNEIFPTSTRAKSVALSGSSNALINWAVVYAIPHLVDSGSGNANLGTKVYFIWAGCCLVSLIFSYMTVFETKGLSLEQIDELYKAVKYAWQSKKYIPTAITFRAQVDRKRSKEKDSADNETTAHTLGQQNTVEKRVRIQEFDPAIDADQTTVQATDQTTIHDVDQTTVMKQHDRTSDGDPDGDPDTYSSV